MCTHIHMHTRTCTRTRTHTHTHIHILYTLQSRNGYDQWLQAEKQRIRSLIDKFWHYSLPRPQLWRHYNPTDYHRAFIILQQKVIG